ncbi:MAG: AI-2E family transporter [Actinomycetia bacterium]|nr:AI-2E family transporter [Actinomycetes bacterium]MCP5032129.1 AI-2E family transporter [Actinomycetes bacterium]
MNVPRTSAQMPPWIKRAIIFWWVILVGLWAALATARQLRGLLIQLVVALFLSFAMEPAVDRLGRYGIKRNVATAITMSITVLFFIGFLVAMGSLVASQLRQLATDLPGYVTSAEEWAEVRFSVELDNADLIQQLSAGGRASEYLSTLADNLVGVGTSLVNVIFQFLAISLFAYYLTADGPRFRKVICSVLPPARQHEVLRIWELAINKTGAFISSRVILAIISAIFHWIVFAALDLPSAVALAIWVGLISQFIPVIGIYIAGVVPALIALGIDPTKALWVLIAVVIYQQIENYGLQPRVTAQTLDMHPAVAFAAVLAGTATFGASGALLALPFVATVQAFISAYIARHTVIENPLLATSGRSSVASPTEPIGGPDDLGLGDDEGDQLLETKRDEAVAAEHDQDTSG